MFKLKKRTVTIVVCFLNIFKNENYFMLSIKFIIQNINRKQLTVKTQCRVVTKINFFGSQTKLRQFRLEILVLPNLTAVVGSNLIRVKFNTINVKNCVISSKQTVYFLVKFI